MKSCHAAGGDGEMEKKTFCKRSAERFFFPSPYVQLEMEVLTDSTPRGKAASFLNGPLQYSIIHHLVCLATEGHMTKNTSSFLNICVLSVHVTTTTTTTNVERFHKDPSSLDKKRRLGADARPKRREKDAFSYLSGRKNGFSLFSFTLKEVKHAYCSSCPSQLPQIRTSHCSHSKLPREQERCSRSFRITLSPKYKSLQLI